MPDWQHAASGRLLAGKQAHSGHIYRIVAPVSVVFAAQATAMSTDLPSPRRLASVARALIAWRRRRADAFDGAAVLFSDPAWAVLLDLYVEEAAGRRVSVTSACIAAGVPAATGLRWLARLETAGLIVRRDDEVDRHRAFVALTPDARTAMTRWLAAVPLPRRDPPG